MSFVHLLCIIIAQNYSHSLQGGGSSPYTKALQFLPTTQRIIEFAEGRSPQPGEKVVYAPGAFDLFRMPNRPVLLLLTELNYVID